MTTRMSHQATETLLRDILAKELGLRDLKPDQPLIDQGLDSLSFVRYIAAILKTVGVGVTTEAVLEAGSIRAVATLIAARDPVATQEANQEVVVGRMPLLPNRVSYFQRREWGLERWVAGVGFFECEGRGDDPALWEEAASIVLGHHDGLRLQISLAGSEIEERIAAPDGLAPVRVLEWAEKGDSSSFLHAAAREAQEDMRFPGELFRILLVQLPRSGRSLVYVMAHHLLVDGVSFRVAVCDLFEVYTNLAAGGEADLPAKTTALPTYAASLQTYWGAQRDEVDRYLAALPWSGLEPSWLDPGPTPGARNLERDSAEVQRVLGPWRAQAEDPAGPVHRWVPTLLAAIGRAYRAATGCSVLCLGLVCHGRESFLDTIDVSRTVGYLVDIVPILIDASASDSTLIASMEEQLQWAWLRGRGYSVTRFVATNAVEPVASLRHPRISLNILPQSLGGWRIPDGFGCRSHLGVDPPPVPDSNRVMRVSGGVFRAGSNLVLSWDYSRQLYERKPMEGFADSCKREYALLMETSVGFSRGLIDDRPTDA